MLVIGERGAIVRVEVCCGRAGGWEAGRVHAAVIGDEEYGSRVPPIEYEAGLPPEDGKDPGPPGWNSCDAGGRRDKSLGKRMFEGGNWPCDMRGGWDGGPDNYCCKGCC